jgi:hypothetical protein
MPESIHRIRPSINTVIHLEENRLSLIVCLWSKLFYNIDIIELVEKAS